MSKPYYISSDYAGIDTESLCFYYGYEFGTNDEEESVWGFYVNMKGDKERRFELPCADDDPNKFEVVEKLLEGIAAYIDLTWERAIAKRNAKVWAEGGPDDRGPIHPSAYGD